MDRVPEMRRVADAAQANDVETRKILNGTLFTQADAGLLKLLSESLKDRKKRERVLQIFEPTDKPPMPPETIVKNLGRFTEIRDGLRDEITENDIRFINFAITYIENWFYRGEWATTPERANRKDAAHDYRYFSLPAAVLNTITKIKELPAYTNKIRSLDPSRLEAFLGEVQNFEGLLFSQSLQDIAAHNPQDKSVAAHELADWVTMRKSLQLSEQSVRRELSGRHVAGDLYFLKTCLVAAEMLRRQRQANHGSELPAIPLVTDSHNEYVLFDFSNGKETTLNSMHYPTLRLPFALVAVEYLHRKSVGSA